jgi:membrane fusion protein (multidrug efflux system)
MLKKFIVVILAVASAIVVLLGASGGNRQLEISNAYVTGRVLDLAAHADGVVDVVKVERGDHVKRGDLLLALDSERDTKAIHQREQELRVSLKEELTTCLAIEIASQTVSGAQAKIESLRERAVRVRKLTQVGAASVDELRSLELSLQQEIISAEQEKLRLTRIKASDHEHLMDRPSIRLAANNLREAFHRKHMNELRAPFDGYVYEVLGFPSAYARAGESQVVFVPSERPTVEANVLESELKFIKPGLRVTIVPDASKERESIEAYIHSIVPSSAATFSKLPRNNVDSNWIKVSQRVPVLISLLDSKSKTELLPIGTSVTVLIPKEYTSADLVNVAKTKAAREIVPNTFWVSEYKKKLEQIVGSETERAAKALSGRCKVSS